MIDHKKITEKYASRANEIFDILSDANLSFNNKKEAFHKYHSMAPVYDFTLAYLTYEVVDELLSMPIVEGVGFNIDFDFGSKWSVSSNINCILEERGDKGGKSVSVFNVHV